jgi:hypothetical protein
MASPAAINEKENRLDRIWKIILDGLTYPDLAGRRRPRSYAVITGVLLLILFFMGGLAFLKYLWMMAPVQAEPVPLEVSPTPTSVLLSLPPTAIPCPVDADQWSLNDVAISKNYKVIQPACVYAGLEQTIAWVQAINNGYTRDQARALLGFSELPMRLLDQAKILTDTQGPKEVALHFTPPTPDFAQWRISDQGGPATVYALRGCFRTTTVVGNQIEAWGGEYPVICVVVEDTENTRILYNLGEHYYTAHAIPTRSFLLFGYLGNGYWVWLGSQMNPTSTLKDFAKMAEERRTVATLFDSQPWDILWLEQRFGLSPQPLPEGWRDFNDSAEQQAILDGLTSGLWVSTP